MRPWGRGEVGVQESYRVGEPLGESRALNTAFCWIFFESPKALGRLSPQGIQAPPLLAPLQHFQPSFRLSIPSPSSLHGSLGTSQSRGQVKAEGPALSRSNDGTSPGSVWSCMSQIHLCPLRSRVLLSGCFWLGVKWQGEGHLCRPFGVIVISR